MAVRPGDPIIEQATEVVIREARRRQRRRQLGMAGGVLVLVGASLIALLVSGSGRSGHTARPPTFRSVAQVKAPVPVAQSVSAGAFAGTWRAHTTSITIAASGIASATWPGTPTAGESEATATPNQASLHLTSVNGTRAVGIVTDSTDPAELPDGPALFQITVQDVLQITPSHPILQYPLGWTGLCGSSAMAMTLSQQESAGINCGA
jgi:hypothetical protein